MSTAFVAAPSTLHPRHNVPTGACDVHSHVFGPFERFAPSQPSSYPLPQAGPVEHKHMRRTLGVERGVLVQPAPYAHDPSAMLSAIAEADGTLVGIAVADAQTDAECLQRWVEGGIRGLRFVDMLTPDGARYPGSVGFAGLDALAPTMRQLGLHAQLWATLPTLVEALPRLSTLGLPLVIDHMAMGGKSATAADARQFLSMVANDDIWVKLTSCRLGRADLGPEPELRAWHDQLVAARPERMLWGSDWPYVRLTPAPDAGRMLDLFCDWLGDDHLIRRILVENPQELFRFDCRSTQ